MPCFASPFSGVMGKQGYPFQIVCKRDTAHFLSPYFIRIVFCACHVIGSAYLSITRQEKINVRKEKSRGSAVQTGLRLSHGAYLLPAGFSPLTVIIFISSVMGMKSVITRKNTVACTPAIVLSGWKYISAIKSEHSRRNPHRLIPLIENNPIVEQSPRPEENIVFFRSFSSSPRCLTPRAEIGR